MFDYAVVADSTCDLSPQQLAQYEIDYFKMTYSAGDQNYDACLDWSQMSSTQFYSSMESGITFKTSQVPMRNFMEKIEHYYSQGQDIIYIACSSALSASVNSAALAADQFKDKYPERKMICVDSLISGMGQGSMVIKAAGLRAEGKSIDETAAWLEEHKFFYDQYGTVQNLEYLKRAGRVTASSAFFGTLFAVKPMLISDSKGQNLAIKKVKGRNASLEELAGYVSKNITEPENQIIYVCDAACPQDGKKLSDMLREKLGDVTVVQSTIGPIVGASVGPGTIIVFYYGKNKKEQEPA